MKKFFRSATPYLLLLPSLLVFILMLATFNRQYRQGTNILGSSQKKLASSVVVSAFIGEYHFCLWGFTSPRALVTLEGMGIFDQVYADGKGYFIFENRFSPFSPREACLTAKDQFGRLSSPLCLPPFPTVRDVTIGPVVLPPTISFDKNDYFMGDEVALSGQTIPGANIDMSMFAEDDNNLSHYLTKVINSAFTSFVRPVNALTFPRLQTVADKQGNFSISLPSADPEKFRLFVQADYQKSISPRSIVLNVQIMPIWMIVVKLLILLWSGMQSHLLDLIIAVDVLIILIYSFRHYLHPYKISKNRALVVRQKYDLMIT